MNLLLHGSKEKMGKKDVSVEGKVENMADYDLLLSDFPKMEYGCDCVLCA